MKKYKLVIPDMIPKKQLLKLNYFIKHDGCKVDIEKLMVYSDNGWIHIRSGIPQEWLHEIEDENPITAKQWITNKYGDDEYSYFDEVEEAFKAGEHNNELRHRETVSFDEYADSVKSNHVLGSKEIWDACKKSRNLGD